MKTLSLKPLLFEISNFLSPVECDHFVEVAGEIGLEESITIGGLQRSGRFSVIDMDKDEQLSVAEAMVTLEHNYDVYLTEEDVLQMYESLGIDENGDQFISKEELQKITPAQMTEYILKLGSENPIKKSRMSHQVWLYPDSSNDTVFKNVQERVQKLTQLPPILVTKSDFQVVRYGRKGHYNAHIDSSPRLTEHPCCTKTRKQGCRICRYMTILFYLNDVQEGGDTAFVVADNETISVEELKISQKINLQRYCDDAKLRVKAEKGKAVMWYNHFVDEETGWLGDLDNYTWHGGCPVTDGEKWIANFWIKATDDKQEDLTLVDVESE